MLLHSHNYYVHMHTLPTVIYSIFLYLPRGLMLCGVFGTNNRVGFVNYVMSAVLFWDCFWCHKWKRVGTAGKGRRRDWYEGRKVGKSHLPTVRILQSTWPQYWYRIVGNFWGEKTFANFTVLWVFVKVFSAKFVGMASVGVTKRSNPQKFSPRKSYFSPICQSFLPREFPAIG